MVLWYRGGHIITSKPNLSCYIFMELYATSACLSLCLEKQREVVRNITTKASDNEMPYDFVGYDFVGQFFIRSKQVSDHDSGP